MNQEILDYINSQRVGVLAVEMLDGSPHAATVHFANTENPLQFFFETSSTYRKAEPILAKEATRASFVIGSSESDMKTLQIDGEIRVITEDNKDLFNEVYFKKFPNKLNKIYGSPQVFFSLKPTWWHFTDWTKPEGKRILTSEDK